MQIRRLHQRALLVKSPAVMQCLSGSHVVSVHFSNSQALLNIGFSFSIIAATHLLVTITA